MGNNRMINESDPWVVLRISLMEEFTGNACTIQAKNKLRLFNKCKFLIIIDSMTTVI